MTSGQEKGMPEKAKAARGQLSVRYQSGALDCFRSKWLDSSGMPKV